MRPDVHAFFDEDTFTVSYVVADPQSRACAVIDSVLDFDQAAGRTSRKSADAIIRFIAERDLRVDWVLETHVHADHLSAAPYIRQQTGGRLGIGNAVTEVQDAFVRVFNIAGDLPCDGRQFDHLFADGEQFRIGSLNAVALHTPGHTPACSTYVIGDAAFVGDTLFMPDYGTARCDFPGGNPRQLYRSIQRIFALPPETRLFMCHDYKAPGRDDYRWETSVAEERARNVHIHDGVSEEEFIALRQSRDAQLGMPRLILPSVQVNIRAGHLPPAEANGQRYLKIPLDAF